MVEQVTKSGTSKTGSSVSSVNAQRGPFYLLLQAASCRLTREGLALTEGRRQPRMSPLMEMSWILLSQLTLAEQPGAARSTVALSAYCQPRREDPLHATMSEVPIEAHKPLKLHVL